MNAKALDIAMYFRAQITSSLLENIPQALSRQMKKSSTNGLMGDAINMKMITFKLYETQGEGDIGCPI